MEGLKPGVHSALRVNVIIVQKYYMRHSFENVTKINIEGQSYEIRDTALTF